MTTNELQNEGGWVEYNGDDAMDTKKHKKSKRKNSRQSSEETENGETDGLSSTILDREPLCSRSLSDTISYIRRRGYDQEDEMDVDFNKTKHFKPAHIGVSKRKLQDIQQWDVDEVLKWLRKADEKLYAKYRSQFEKKRIDGQKLINSCGSSQFLRGVVGMVNGHLDISRFLSILGQLKGDPAPDITLSHEDEYGKPMTAKEAFRKLSHKFHGKKSGPKKQEKRLKKRMEQLERKKQNNVDTPLGTLEKLRQTTQTLHKPFVVLDKH